VAGLALLRLYPDGPPDRVGQVLASLAATLREDTADPDDPLQEREAGAGYDEWSLTYDRPNPVQLIGDPVFDPLLAAAPLGVAADVACGTGRIALKLVVPGRHVIAVDANEGMLAVLSAIGTSIEIRPGRLDGLPIGDGELDLLTCALALTHVPELGPVFREFARVLKPGGQALLSDIHPLVCAMGGQAYYRDVEGQRRFVRNRFHTHSEYISAFVAAGLAVQGCWEPLFGPSRSHLLSPGTELDPDLALLAFGGLPGLLIWKLTRQP